MEKISVLEATGRSIESQRRESELIELYRLLGSQQAFTAMGVMASAQAVRMIHEVKASKRYELTGLSWDQFCEEHLRIGRRRADQLIKLLEQLGDEYFALRDMVRLTPAVYEQLQITNGKLVNGSEEITITKANAARIGEIVTTTRDQMRKANQKAADATRAAKEARKDRDQAKASEKAAQDELETRRTRDERMYPDLTGNQRRLRRAQEMVMGAAVEMRGVVGSDEATDQEHAEVFGLRDWAIGILAEASGSNPLNPMETELLRPRNLIQESALFEGESA